MIYTEPHGADTVEVTFSTPANGLSGPLAVVGDFNDWDRAADPLIRVGATYQAGVVLDCGRRYAYRYLAGDLWFNDQAADDYQPNEFGGSDSVVDLTGV